MRAMPCVRSAWHRCRCGSDRIVVIGSLLAVGAVAVVTSAERAVPPYCDTELLDEVGRQQLDSFERYQPRGENAPDRCEGLHGKKHKLGGATLAGLWLSCQRPTPPADRPDLAIAWTAPPTGTVRLRARTLPQSRPYLMDSEATAPASTFRWPQTLLRVLRIDPSKLGVLAWTLNGPDPVYLPVRWLHEASQDCEPDYHILFDHVASTETAAVRVTGVPGNRIVEGDFNPRSAWIVLARKALKGPGPHEIGVTFGKSIETTLILASWGQP
jgi:hypothetical protein